MAITHTPHRISFLGKYNLSRMGRERGGLDVVRGD